MSTGTHGLPPAVRDALRNARLTNYNFMGYSGNEAAEQVCDDIEKAMLAAPATAQLSEDDISKLTAAVLAFAWSPKLNLDEQADGVKTCLRGALLRQLAETKEGE